MTPPTLPLRAEALITGRTRTTVSLRIPELHPHRILTLPAAALSGAKGDRVPVEVRSPIESTALGYGALIVEVHP